MGWFKIRISFWKKKVAPTSAFDAIEEAQPAPSGSGSDDVEAKPLKASNDCTVVAIPASTPEEVPAKVATWLNVRKNGCQLPPSMWQVVSSSLVVYFEVTSHCLLYCVPYFAPLLVIQDLVLVVLVGSSVYTMATNAAIPQVKHKSLVYPGKPGVDQFNYCHTCETHVPRRTKHCNYCNKCVFRFDHHCFVANNCIGSANYHGFLTMLVTAVIFLLYLSVLSAIAIGLYLGLGFNPMFGLYDLDFRVWIFLNLLNCLAALGPLAEFLPLLRTQYLARQMGLTQFEYYRHLSVLRRQKEAEKAAQLEVVVIAK